MAAHPIISRPESFRLSNRPSPIQGLAAEAGTNGWSFRPADCCVAARCQQHGVVPLGLGVQQHCADVPVLPAICAGQAQGGPAAAASVPRHKKGNAGSFVGGHANHFSPQTPRAAWTQGAGPTMSNRVAQFCQCSGPCGELRPKGSLQQLHQYPAERGQCRLCCPLGARKALQSSNPVSRQPATHTTSYLQCR